MRNVVYSSTLTDVATVLNFEYVYDKYNVDGIHTKVINSSHEGGSDNYSNNNNNNNNTIMTDKPNALSRKPNNVLVLSEKLTHY